MQRILTLPRWECRAPAPFRRRNESYWCCAELPLATEWMFIINTAADPEMQLPQRSLLAATTDHLLDLLAELGPNRVKSVYQLFRGTAGDDDALMINRLTAIHVGEDSQDDWRKVFVFHTDSGVPIVDGRDIEAVARTTNRVEVARFKRTEKEPCSEAGATMAIDAK
jgi:hypothetical protein